MSERKEPESQQYVAPQDGKDPKNQREYYPMGQQWNAEAGESSQPPKRCTAEQLFSLDANSIGMRKYKDTIIKLMEFFAEQERQVSEKTCAGEPSSAPPAAKMNDDQIKYMVNRFLAWRLPDNFNPDGGISFKPIRNEKTPWPAKNEPTGTNLLDAMQAEGMIRYLVDGMAVAARELKSALPLDELIAEYEKTRAISADQRVVAFTFAQFVRQEEAKLRSGAAQEVSPPSPEPNSSVDCRCSCNPFCGCDCHKQKFSRGGDTR